MKHYKTDSKDIGKWMKNNSEFISNKDRQLFTLIVIEQNKWNNIYKILIEIQMNCWKRNTVNTAIKQLWLMKFIMVYWRYGIGEIVRNTNEK